MKNKQIDEPIIRHHQLLVGFEDVNRKHIDIQEQSKDIKSILYTAK
ncbi:hypothetical protein HCX49_24400 [Sphingobacterium kitahiroshimense]|nr:hypothetical protein [Sphingobacterium sp. B16(2022)]NJI76336.1 hypothetical protein [Sphingobacterium sp. B16(2022)]